MNNAANIRRISFVLQYACYIVMLTLVFAGLYFAWKLRTAPEQVIRLFMEPAQPLLQRIGATSGLKLLIASGLAIGPTLLYIHAYRHLSKLFGQFRGSSWFTETSANHLFVFAITNLVVHVLRNPLLGIADYVTTPGTAERTHGMPLVINGDEITYLIMIGAFVTISWIIREGTRLARENAEFI